MAQGGGGGGIYVHTFLLDALMFFSKGWYKNISRISLLYCRMYAVHTYMNHAKFVSIFAIKLLHFLEN